MADNNLKEGISILYDMEQNNYLMSCSIDRLNSEISRLGIPKTFAKPKKEYNNFSVFESIYAFIGFGGILGGIIGAVWGFFSETGFFVKLFSAVGGLITVGLIGGIVGAVIGLIVGISLKSSANKDIENNYKIACNNYDAAVSNDHLRVKRELAERNVLISMRNDLINRKNEATNKLRGYYSTMGIDGDFRNLIPIGYMYEFLRLGIANKLDGADGLYYLVMQELRHDELQLTMEEISSKLDLLLENQHRVYRELQDLNYKSNEMVSLAVQSARTSVRNNQLLSEISENSSIAAYNSQRLRSEMAFQTFMLAYK